MKHFKTFLTILALALAASAAAFPASAQEAFSGIELSPIQAILHTVPGKDLTTQFQLTNKSTATLRFELQIVERQGDKVLEKLVDQTAGQWVNLGGQTTIELTPNNTQGVTVNLNVPVGAPIGSYQLQIIAKALSAESAAGSNASVLPAIAYSIVLNVVDQLPEDSVLSSVYTSQQLVLTPTIDATWELANNTGFTIFPLGYLRVVAPTGDFVAQQIINENQAAVAPNGKISAQAVNISFADLGMPRALGVYTVELLAVDPQLQRSSLSKYTFWYIPLPILIAAAGALIVLVVFFVVIRRRRSKNPRIKKAGLL